MKVKELLVFAKWSIIKAFAVPVITRNVKLALKSGNKEWIAEALDEECRLENLAFKLDLLKEAFKEELGS